MDASTLVLGLHRILPMAFGQLDVSALRQTLISRLEASQDDAAAMMDMSMILHSYGNPKEALALLHEAVKIQRDFCVVHGDGTGIRILAFVTPGDFMANVPVDFLLKGSNAVLWLHYVDADTADLDNLPEHDVAFLAISEANGHGPILQRMEQLLSTWTGPIMNNDAALIGRLTRDGVSDMLAGEATILSPVTHRVERAALTAVAQGADPAERLGLDFPMIVRPIGTHAGSGLGRVETAGEVQDYLATQASEHFYAAPFVDYRGPHGWFAKQRIVLINGTPFASHMALSDHWMIHYLNANMADNARKRSIEADWMATFDSDFVSRHQTAFDALYDRLGLDYFGIDCAELPDGRLLVFELDVAMVVHDMDDPQIFPYKQAVMQKLFDAFVQTAEATHRSSRVNAA